MTAIRILDMKEGMSIEGFYALQDANLLTTTQGKPYIRMVLSDASGNLQANMWDASQEIFNSVAVGAVVKIRAGVESYRGNPQLKITALRPAHESEYDPADFVAHTSADIEELKKELVRLINRVSDNDYNAILHAFFDDADILEAFCRAPAAKMNHHAYLGGLLEHTISITKLAEVICATSSTGLNQDLLITGALLHDIGKIEELAITTTIDYTDKGKLIGHLMIGAQMVQDRASAIESIPEEKVWLLMHMILSHHGKFEYGSPVLPAVPEAIALHHIDNLDAKTVAARRIIDEDLGNERTWTDRSWMLETKLFKGSLPQTKETPESSPSIPEGSGESGSLF